MLNEHFFEENYAMILKLTDINPYFNTAISCLYHCSICNLQDDPSMFEEYQPVIFPNIIVTDNPFPDIECKTSILLKKENRIEISYGVFILLGALGKFGDLIDKMYHEAAGEYSLEYLSKINIDDLKACLEDVFRYLAKAKKMRKGATPPIPEMTLSKDLLFYALKFLIGHELSHYFDYYYISDVRSKRQFDAFNNSNELLKSCKSTIFEKEAIQFYIQLCHVISASGVPGMRMYQLWGEEVLADLEGFQYLFQRAPVGYRGFRALLGIGIAFIMAKIIEFYQFSLSKKISLSIDISWREVFLQYNIYRKFGDYYDTFPTFLFNKFGGWLCLIFLYRRLISELHTDWEVK